MKAQMNPEKPREYDSTGHDPLAAKLKSWPVRRAGNGPNRIRETEWGLEPAKYFTYTRMVNIPLVHHHGQYCL